MKTTSTFAATFIITLALNLSAGETSHKPLVVHEWGTFTVLQDDEGRPVDGVNINEESLPAFVHRLDPNLAPDSHQYAAATGLGFYLPRTSKGIRRYYHAARMRMETPIIYLYPPDDQPERAIDVDVDFHGGWITEWYPDAQCHAPGYKKHRPGVMMNLTPSTVGRIGWRGIRTAPGGKAPATDLPVWLAPRETAAPPLATPKGEVENYLFYRGVADLEAPLRVVRKDHTLNIMPNPNTTCPIKDFGHVLLWLVDVDMEGRLQYRRVSSTMEEGLFSARTAASFKNQPGGNLTALRKEMLDALIDEGLYRDEAEAMLNTWEASYFQTSGLRLFFTLPQTWTDRVLPLKVSGYDKTEVVRAMIGRIEMMAAQSIAARSANMELKFFSSRKC
ncbi:MAG: hypothetical protein AAF492_02425 [Verrucomicrobiota bacterium]